MRYVLSVSEILEQPGILASPRSLSSQDPGQPKIPVRLKSQSAQDPSQHWMPSCLFGLCLFGIWLMLLNFSSIYYIPTWISVMCIWHICIFPSLKNHMSQGPAVELLLARSEVKWLLIHLRACRYIWTKIGLWFAKCRKGFANYFEYLGKLLKSGKAWESFLSFIY